MDDHLSDVPALIAEENAQLTVNRIASNYRLGDYLKSTNSW